MRQPRRTAGNGMEWRVIKPTSIEDAREITETLLANRTVVLTLRAWMWMWLMRIIDFTSGSCFAISGNLQKISQYIYLLLHLPVWIFPEISRNFQRFGRCSRIHQLTKKDVFQKRRREAALFERDTG